MLSKEGKLCVQRGRVRASETMKWLWKAHDFCFLNTFFLVTSVKVSLTFKEWCSLVILYSCVFQLPANALYYKTKILL